MRYIRSILTIVCAALCLLSLVACQRETVVPETTAPPLSAVPSLQPGVVQPSAELPTGMPDQALPEAVEASFFQPDEAGRINQYSVNLATDAKRIGGGMELRYYNGSEDALEAVYVHLYPNAVEPGCFAVQSVCYDEAQAHPINYRLEQEGALVMIPLARPLRAGESVALWITFTLEIPELEGRFGRDADAVTLGNFLPIFSVYEDGAWRKDAYTLAGDAFYSETADYTVRLTSPARYTLAATGKITEQGPGSGGTVSTTISASGVRDFALALMRDAKRWEMSGPEGVSVNVTAGRQAHLEFLGVNAIDILGFFNQRIGTYAYDSLSITPCGLTSGGMEYPGMILIGTRYLFPEQQDMGKLILAHEVAHQWWYSAVGTDAIREPWVDEALCEFLSFDYIRQTYGEALFETLWKARFSGMREGALPAVALGSDLYAFNENAYFESVYAYGSRMYRELYDDIGGDAFYAALRAVYEQNVGQRGAVSGESLITAFSEAAGKDLSGWFEDKLQAKR